MAFKPVRSSRPVQWTPCDFLPNPHYSCRRDDFHLSKFPDYPDPERLLSYTQKYFFRNAALRHLRVEQFTRLEKKHTCPTLVPRLIGGCCLLDRVRTMP